MFWLGLGIGFLVAVIAFFAGIAIAVPRGWW